jgi:hypothetical protein
MKRITLFVVVSFAWLAGGILWAQPKNRPFKRVEAEEFVLVDAEGREMVLLGDGGDGKEALPALIFLDKAGTPRIRLFLGKRGAYMAMNPAGEAKAPAEHFISFAVNDEKAGIFVDQKEVILGERSKDFDAPAKRKD